MTAQAPERAPDLSGVPEEKLAGMLRAALARDDRAGREAAQILTAEFDRRDAEAKSARKREAAARRRAAHQAKQAEWRDAAWAQYQRASEECRGRLLSRAGMEAAKRWQSDEFLLWSLSARDAERYASEELNDFWRGEGGRLTFGRWNSLHSAAADRRRWKDEQRWAQADTSEHDGAADLGTGLTVWTVWRDCDKPLPESRHVVIEGGGEQARQAAEAYARKVWGWEAEQVTQATTVTADSARALHERQKAEAAGIVPGQGGGGAGGGDERRIKPTPPAQEATIHAAGENAPSPPAGGAEEDTPEARALARAQRAERMRERAMQGAALTGRPVPAVPAPRGGGACRHPERPGNGKRVCDDCPKRRPGSALAPAMSGTVVTPQAAAFTRTYQDVDPAELLRETLNEIALYLSDWVWFRGRADVIATTLWIAHAAARDAERNLIWRASPRLLLTSKQNGSGKSTVLDLISILLKSQAGRMVKVTPYGMVKALNAYKDVALPDDAQLMFSGAAAGRELLAVLLGSYSRGGSWNSGKQGGSIEKVYGPVALAGKDELITKYVSDEKSPVRDLLARSIILRFARPPRYMPEIDEDAEDEGARLGDLLAGALGALQSQLASEARSLSRELRGQVIADGDGGRTAQIWRPLHAVARVAGGPWPAAAERAAAVLAAGSGDLITAEQALRSLKAERAQRMGTPERSFWDGDQEDGW